MQVINRPNFLKKAEANRIRAEVILPTRGGIFDRYGRLLVENRPAYTLYAYPWMIKRNPKTVVCLADVLQIEAKELNRRIGRFGWYTFQSAAVQRDVPFKQLARLETLKIDLPGIAFEFEAKRAYPLPEAVHLLGYVGEHLDVSGENRKSRVGLVGKRGLELVYEDWLSGKPGIRYIQVDVSGKSIGTIPDNPTIPPQAGWDLQLNIDGYLQKYAFDLMEDRAGAVVAIDPRDGGMLAMLSLPDYDPSLFAGVMPPGIWDRLKSDPGHPLLNRTVQGLYSPGSTYKMAILAAALEDKIVTNQTRFMCIGGLQIGRRFFSCWKKAGHGSVGWKESIQQSCDVFYYSIGLKLGVDIMSEYVRHFGFGVSSGIDFDTDFKGIIPDTKYMDRKYGKRGWTRGQAANISIGQGDVLVTPMQLAVYTAAIATGYIVQPRIAYQLLYPDYSKTISIEPELRPVEISPQTFRKLREGMRLVVNAEDGTAYWLKREDIVIAGKTGTVENPHGEDHGLFIGYAPFNDPVIAVAVVVEHGEHGSTSAAPVACKLIERYVNDLYPKPRALPHRTRAPRQEMISRKEYPLAIN